MELKVFIKSKMFRLEDFFFLHVPGRPGRKISLFTIDGLETCFQ